MGLVQSRWPVRVHGVNESAEAKYHRANAKQFRAFWEITRKKSRDYKFYVGP